MYRLIFSEYCFIPLILDAVPEVTAQKIVTAALPTSKYVHVYSHFLKYPQIRSVILIYIPPMIIPRPHLKEPR